MFQTTIRQYTLQTFQAESAWHVKILLGKQVVYHARFSGSSTALEARLHGVHYIHTTLKDSLGGAEGGQDAKGSEPVEVRGMRSADTNDSAGPQNPAIVRDLFKSRKKHKR